MDLEISDRGWLWIILSLIGVLSLMVICIVIDVIITTLRLLGVM